MVSGCQKVEIGLPVFNGERYLEEVLKSILAQSFEAFRLTISDNASTDRTGEICRAYAAKDPRISYMRNDANIGAAANYNKVFHHSDCEYFKWATADDLWGPDLLRRCVDSLDTEDDVILAYPKTSIIDETGKFQRKYEDGLNLVSDSPPGRFLQVIYNCRLCNPVLGVIRRNDLARTRLIPDYVGGDKVLLAELSFLGKFREVPEFLHFRRFYAAPSSTNLSPARHRPSVFKRSSKEQLEWLNPQCAHRPASTQWRLCRGYLTAIARSQIGFVRKIHPTLFILATLFVNRKYRAELKEAVQRRFTESRTTTQQ